MDEAHKQAVVDFLKEYKHIATTKRKIDVIPRKENRDALIELGLTERNREDEILSLSLQDFCNGPEADRDRAGVIWEFGKEINGKEVYIKLKIAETSAGKIAKCLSFHEARFPQCYPCK